MVISSAALALPANSVIEPAIKVATRYRIVVSLGIESDFPSLRGAKRRSNPSFLCRSMDCFASLAMTIKLQPQDSFAVFEIGQQRGRRPLVKHRGALQRA